MAWREQENHGSAAERDIVTAVTKALGERANKTFTLYTTEQSPWPVGFFEVHNRFGNALDLITNSLEQRPTHSLSHLIPKKTQDGDEMQSSRSEVLQWQK